MSAIVNVSLKVVSVPPVSEIYSVIKTEVEENGVFAIGASSDEMYESTMKAIDQFGEAPDMRYSVVTKGGRRIIIIFSLSLFANQELFRLVTGQILTSFLGEHDS